MAGLGFEHIPAKMWAVVTTGNGGYDKLDYRQVPVPTPGAGELLLRVLAAGMNNTEINTRLGWYSSSVTGSTADLSTRQQDQAEQKADGGWNEATPFPIIQGTDCCGLVVAAADESGAVHLGKRVLVRACMRPDGFGSLENIWMASDFDGAFAQYVKVPTTEIFAVDCDWSDAELATIPLCLRHCRDNASSGALPCRRQGAGDRRLWRRRVGGGTACQAARCACHGADLGVRIRGAEGAGRGSRGNP